MPLSATPPESLNRLLAASTDPEREAAWTAFLEEHSGLMLHAARSQGGDHDAVMDRYLFVITALRDHDFRRLRSYAADGGRFSTWLLVVARRLCFDDHRARYGRPQSDAAASTARHVARRQLVDLIGGEFGLESLEATPEDDLELGYRREELRGALRRALDQLPAGERLLLRFRFEDGLSVPEIARLVGMESPFAMYRRLEKVLAHIRVILNAFGVEDSVP